MLTETAPTVPSDTRRLIKAVTDLSQAREIDQIRSIVRTAAREMVSADGATFVLRDGDLCHYVDEDAIGPLWKGQRFAMSACISGWAMSNRQPASVPDIFVDPRIPVDAYRPTFVRSLVMVPVRESDPIGAIGTYWATPQQATPRTVELLQALANTTAVAMENVRVYHELEDRVRQRTAELAAANEELGAFAHSVSHDLRAPLRHIGGYAALLREQSLAGLSSDAQRYVDRIVGSADQMSRLIEDMLAFAKLGRAPLHAAPVDLRSLVDEARDEVMREAGSRSIEWSLPSSSVVVPGDRPLLKQVLLNLLSNAVKYTRGRTPAAIAVALTLDNEAVRVTVRDNGAGFDQRYADKLFQPFQRLHADSEFEGTGVGLATVRRIIARHGGEIRGSGAPNEGATFSFTLPRIAPA